MVPAVAVGGALPTLGDSFGLLFAYRRLWHRMVREREALGDRPDDARLYAAAMIAAKLAGTVGVARFFLRTLPAGRGGRRPEEEDLFGAVVGKYRGRIADDTSDNPLRDYARACRFPDDLPELARALEAIVLRDRHYLVLWYIDLLSFSGRHFRNELAPNVLLSSGQIKARLDELRRTKALRVEPGVAFTMIYVHLFNFFLVEHIFGSGNAYGLAKEEAVRAICDAFLHGIVGDRRAARPPVRRARKRR